MKTNFLFASIIQVVFCCQIYEKERNFYSTLGEYSNLFMNELFEGENLIYQCKNCQENVTLWNTMNMIGKPQKTEYIFRSIAYNKTHFVALTDNHTINIYNWLDQSLNTAQILPFSSDLNCINIIFTFNNKFLIDCYFLNRLYMYYLEESSLKLVFQTQTIYPLRTNIYSFISNTTNYNIYAQYYLEYSILTLFKQYLKLNQTFFNVSTWISTFQDVEISIKGDEFNTFYVLNQYEILLLQINENENFQVQNIFQISPLSYQMTIYQSVKIYSECDQLFLKSNSSINSLLLCSDPLNKELYQQNLMSYNIEENQEIKNFYANDEFLIIQTNNSIMIISIETNILLRQTKSLNSQIYFNNLNNELFIFNQYTFVYQIETPRLSGYFQPNQKNDQIYIYAIDNFGVDICFVNITIKVLNLDDFGIYELYKNQIENYYTLEQKKFVQQIKNIYGSLLDIQYNQDSYNLGYFKNITLLKIYEFNQDFQMMKLLYIDTTYVVGISKKTMTIFAMVIPTQLIIKTQLDLDVDDNRILKDIQLAYQFQGQQIVLIIGINCDSNTLLFYQATLSQNSMTILQNSSLQTFHFNQYLLSFNCYILQFDNRILLYSFNNYQVSKIDQETIEIYLGVQIDFNPSEMVMDQQHQSSILFVSNKNSFLIFIIDFNLNIIPQAIYNVSYIIQQISIVNQKLILAYKCNQDICFDVWNTQNLRTAFSEKRLISVTKQIDINCYSDNQFYYAKIDKNQVLVYNPLLSYHQSLYTSIQINGSYFSSTQVYDFSILAFGNSLYTLQPFFTFQYIRNTDFQTNEYLPNTIYNQTIKSQFSNFSYITNNQSLSILNPQLNIFIQTIIITIEFGSPLNYTFTFENISTIGQILYFDLQSANKKHTECIRNFENSLQDINQVSNSEYYSIITVVNNVFVLQNYNQLTIYNTNVSLKTNNTINCYQSYAYENTLYSYCYNTTNYYILSFQINNNSIIQNDQIIMLPIEESFLLETPFSILSDGVFYRTYDGQLSYYNFYSQQNINITNCTVGEFQPIQIKNSKHYCLVVIFFLCNNNFQNLNYIFANYTKENYTIQLQNQYSSINIFNLYLKNIRDFYIQYFQIIKVEIKEIMMLITTNEQLSFLILFNVKNGIFDQNNIEIKFQDLISTIPPYNTQDYELSSSPKIQGANLLIALLNKNSRNEILLLVYDLSDLSQYNRSTPIRLQGGYIIPSTETNSLISFQLITENRNKGQILVLTTQQIYLIGLSTFTFSLTVPLYSTEKSIKFNLTGENSYYKYLTQIEFQYETKKGWLYGLNALLAIMFTISLIYCWRRRKTSSDFTLNHDEWTDF